jgi:hypothetical protein
MEARNDSCCEWWDSGSRITLRHLLGAADCGDRGRGVAKVAVTTVTVRRYLLDFCLTHVRCIKHDHKTCPENKGQLRYQYVFHRSNDVACSLPARFRVRQFIRYRDCGRPLSRLAAATGWSWHEWNTFKSEASLEVSYTTCAHRSSLAMSLACQRTFRGGPTV